MAKNDQTSDFGFSSVYGMGDGGMEQKKWKVVLGAKKCGSWVVRGGGKMDKTAAKW